MLLQFIIIAVIASYLLNRFYFRGAKCQSQNRLDDRTIIITGANTGIGYYTALLLAKRGAHIIMACRDTKKAEKAAEEIRKLSFCDKVEVEYLDLADFDSVRSFVRLMYAKLNKLDILINNAGIMQIGNGPLRKTKQGFEMQFGVNHLGHFLLTNLLVDLMTKASASRIINVSSLAHKSNNFIYGGHINWKDINSEHRYNPFNAYCQSKLANILFTVELADRLKNSQITCVSLHPGIVRTEILRYSNTMSFISLDKIATFFSPIYRIFSLSAEEGCQTTLHCALDDNISQLNGCYFSDCRPAEAAKQAQSKQDAERLWEMSAKLVNL